MNESPQQPTSGPSTEPPDSGRLTHPGRETRPETGAEGGADSVRARLQADQSRRWHQGERRPVEAYLADHPELARDPDFVLALINGELLQREQLGDPPSLGEYLARFPALADRLRPLFVVLECLRKATTSGRPGDDSAGATVESEQPAYLDRYRVVSRLGRGAFGVVYLCDDEQLGRRVALKVPHRERLARPGAAEKYLEEARALARLDHPGIVPIYDVGRTPDGLCFFVSKYMEGGSLAGRLRQGRVGLAEAAALVADVAEALQHAHERGLVHRDVKPGNVLLDVAGRPVVADFGLALREQDFGRGAGTVLGTPAYMSPEQARGEGHRVDARSDVYSLGAVLYELLTGRLPFEGATAAAIMEQIGRYEPRPPRQVNPAVPRELDRICLKAMAGRASDRYSIARDMAEELRAWLAAGTAAPAPAGAAAGPAPPTSAPPEARVVPRGLRPFGADDADFFLQLLPGPRNRDGLPDSVRFWKARAEETDPEQTFAVGLLFGPSGCGKSSLVRAGILPRLAPHVVAAYVEATPQDTEGRLMKVLRKHCPDLFAGAALPEVLGGALRQHCPNLFDTALPEALMLLRRGAGLPAGKKLLLVLDQFEQWLHAHPAAAAAELTEALRQCDGEHVQCLLLVRDDFGMAAARFLRELEVPIASGHNFAAVDLFDARHARKVLAEFGRAYGCLPDGALTPEQEQFLEQAVAGLAEGGRVIPVRLALFAEMVKAKPWTAASLKAVGGAAGIGVAFLEEALGSRAANPAHRLHGPAARAVLKALLPQPGSNLKGTMRSHAQLLEASGHAGRPRDFDELRHLLDAELRLITPTDPEGAGEAAPSSSDAGESYYQLTHDYLVPSIREWLTQNQKQTRRGRAELLLQDRRQMWEPTRENRLLPSPLEVLGILLWAPRQGRTPTDGQMLRRAVWVHGWRLAAAAVLVAVVILLTLALQPKPPAPPPPPRPPLELFRDRDLPDGARLNALSQLSLQNEGVMAQVILALGDEPRKPAFVKAALEQLAARVADGQVAPSGPQVFVKLLKDLLADRGQDDETHQAAFECLMRDGPPADVLAGVLGYFREGPAQPLDDDLLRYLVKAFERAGEAPQNADQAVLHLLRTLAERHQGATRAEGLGLFVRVAPPPLALEVAADHYRREPTLAGPLLSCINRLELAKLDEAPRQDVLWQLNELIRAPRLEDDGVVRACAKVLDRVEVDRLCGWLFDAYFAGRGVDGKGSPPDPDQSADVVLMPYVGNTSAARVREIQHHVLRRLGEATRRVGGKIPNPEPEELLPYLMQAVVRLREQTGAPWPDALGVVAGLLKGHRDFEDESIRRFLLSAVGALGNDDGPIDLAPVYEILESPPALVRGRDASSQVWLQARIAAARALGELHDAKSVALLMKVADNAGESRTLRIAALEALGRVGGFLKGRRQPVEEIADYLGKVLRQRESDTGLTMMAVNAFGEVVDPARVVVLFDLLLNDHHALSAQGAAQHLMARTEDDCRAVTRAYVKWRVAREADLAAGYFGHPDEVVLWLANSRKAAYGDATAVMKVVAPTLAQACCGADPRERQAAAVLLNKLLRVPGAPRPSPEEPDADKRAGQLRAWLRWWDENQKGLRHAGRSLIRG